MKTAGFAIALLVLAFLLAPAGDHRGSGPSIQAQAQAPREPLDYFSDMMPVFTHARCMNCHGVVDPETGVNHDGGVVGPGESCTSSCHNQADNDNRTGLDDWHLPPPERFFVGKDVRALCAQMAERVARDGQQHFMDHLQSDLQIDLGFQGRSGGAREDPQPDVPPMPKDDFLVKAALWMDDGLAACDREGRITYVETIASNESQDQGPVSTVAAQSGRRTVTVDFANGRYQARIDVSGRTQITQTMSAVVNGRPCQTVIRSIGDYEDTGVRASGGPRGMSATPRVAIAFQRNGEYTITVHLPEEKHRQRNHGSVSDGCGARLPPPSPETIEQTWPDTRFILKGRLSNPRDRSRLVGGETKIWTARISPDEDPWLPDHYAAMALDGRIHPVTVTATWNLRYRP